MNLSDADSCVLDVSKNNRWSFSFQPGDACSESKRAYRHSDRVYYALVDATWKGLGASRGTAVLAFSLNHILDIGWPHKRRSPTLSGVVKRSSRRGGTGIIASRVNERSSGIVFWTRGVVECGQRRRVFESIPARFEAYYDANKLAGACPTFGEVSISFTVFPSSQSSKRSDHSPATA